MKIAATQAVLTLDFSNNISLILNAIYRNALIIAIQRHNRKISAKAAAT